MSNRTASKEKSSNQKIVHALQVKKPIASRSGNNNKPKSAELIGQIESAPSTARPQLRKRPSSLFQSTASSRAKINKPKPAPTPAKSKLPIKITKAKQIFQALAADDEKMAIRLVDGIPATTTKEKQQKLAVLNMKNKRGETLLDKAKAKEEWSEFISTLTMAGAGTVSGIAYAYSPTREVIEAEEKVEEAPVPRITDPIEKVIDQLEKIGETQTLPYLNRAYRGQKNINAQDAKGMTLLMHVAKEGCGLTVDLLLQNGADANLTDHKGFTALMHAAKRGHVYAVLMLLPKVKDIDATDMKGKTALMYATESRDLATVQCLLRHGATALGVVIHRFKNIHPNGTQNDLHQKISGDLKKIERNINRYDEYGVTPLMQAASDGNFSEVLRLLEKGANPNLEGKPYLSAPQWGRSTELTDKVGKTALMFAADSVEGNAAKICQALIEKGAKINAQDSHGKTPLVYGVASGNIKIVELLLNAGANGKCKGNKEGNSILEYLMHCYHTHQGYQYLSYPHYGGYLKADKRRLKTSNYLLNQDQEKYNAVTATLEQMFIYLLRRGMDATHVKSNPDTPASFKLIIEEYEYEQTTEVLKESFKDLGLPGVLVALTREFMLCNPRKAKPSAAHVSPPLSPGRLGVLGVRQSSATGDEVGNEAAEVQLSDYAAKNAANPTYGAP